MEKEMGEQETPNVRDAVPFQEEATAYLQELEASGQLYEEEPGEEDFVTEPETEPQADEGDAIELSDDEIPEEEAPVVEVDEDIHASGDQPQGEPKKKKSRWEKVRERHEAEKRSWQEQLQALEQRLEEVASATPQVDARLQEMQFALEQERQAAEAYRAQLEELGFSQDPRDVRIAELERQFQLQRRQEEIAQAQAQAAAQARGEARARRLAIEAQEEGARYGVDPVSILQTWRIYGNGPKEISVKEAAERVARLEGKLPGQRAAASRQANKAQHKTNTSAPGTIRPGGAPPMQDFPATEEGMADALRHIFGE